MKESCILFNNEAKLQQVNKYLYPRVFSVSYIFIQSDIFLGIEVSMLRTLCEGIKINRGFIFLEWSKVFNVDT